MPEIHYFWSPQILQRPKYTISGRRKFYSARNTVFLAVASLHGLEIQYFRATELCDDRVYSALRPSDRCVSGRVSG